MNCWPGSRYPKNNKEQIVELLKKAWPPRYLRGSFHFARGSGRYAYESHEDCSFHKPLIEHKARLTRFTWDSFLHWACYLFLVYSRLFAHFCTVVGRYFSGSSLCCKSTSRTWGTIKKASSEADRLESWELKVPTSQLETPAGFIIAIYIYIYGYR